MQIECTLAVLTPCKRETIKGLFFRLSFLPLFPFSPFLFSLSLCLIYSCILLRFYFPPFLSMSYASSYLVISTPTHYLSITSAAFPLSSPSLHCLFLLLSLSPTPSLIWSISLSLFFAGWDDCSAAFHFVLGADPLHTEALV